MSNTINVNEMKAILQGMIFVSETPVTIKQMLTKINAVYKKQQNEFNAAQTDAETGEVIASAPETESDDTAEVLVSEEQADVAVDEVNEEDANEETIEETIEDAVGEYVAANINAVNTDVDYAVDAPPVVVSMQAAALSILATSTEEANESVAVDNAIHDDEDDNQALAHTDLAINMVMVKAWLKELQDDYQSPQHGFELVYVAKGYQFRTKVDVAIALHSDKKAMPSRLSASALETLAIVAYEQPVTRPKVDDVRGVDSGGVLKTLLEKEFLRIVGRADEAGSPLLYGTTPKFLEVFNLKSLKDLPSLAEIKDLYLKAEDDAADEPAQYFDSEEVLEQRVNAMSEEEMELMNELDESLTSLKDVEHSIAMFNAPKPEVTVDADDGSDSSMQ